MIRARTVSDRGGARRRGCAAIAFLCATACATACATGKVEPPPGWIGPFDAASVLARAVEAAGGRAALEIPASVRTRSRVVLHPPGEPPIEAELHYAARGGSREWRELTTGSGRHLLQVIDGARTLEIENGAPTGRDLAPEAATRRIYRSLLLELAEPGGEPARLVRSPGANPSDTAVVERALADGARWQAWIEAPSMRVTRIRRLFAAAGAEHVDEDWIGAHEEIGGRVVPFHQVTWRDGRRVKEAWLLEYEEGIDLPDALFEIPDAAPVDQAPARAVRAAATIDSATSSAARAVGIPRRCAWSSTSTSERPIPRTFSSARRSS